jgi:8-oxo-dGTP pyrophosphatase MutT (NUDIX family)
VSTPEFILELRNFIGTRRLWLCGATAVVLRSTGTREEVLLVRRSDNDEWSPVSGIVDPGEHPASTAIREVAEEAGVQAVVERLSWVTVTDVVTYANGDQTQYLDHVFRCRWSSGEPYPADGEATEARFFPLDALPALRTDYRQRVLAALSTDPATRLN